MVDVHLPGFRTTWQVLAMKSYEKVFSPSSMEQTLKEIFIPCN